MVPPTVAGLFQNPTIQSIADTISWGQPIYYLLYIAAIIFFCYFYVSIIFNPEDTAENMRKYGGFIPGIRSGRRTAEYIDRILTRLTLIGSLYLAAVSVLPELLLFGFKVESLPFVGALARRLPAGAHHPGHGHRLLLRWYLAPDRGWVWPWDFVQQVESQLVMRNYDGFMKKGRVRGRR